jgi:hypothetical protein
MKCRCAKSIIIFDVGLRGYYRGAFFMVYMIIIRLQWHYIRAPVLAGH